MNNSWLIHDSLTWVRYKNNAFGGLNKQEKTKDLYAKHNKSLEPERKENSSNKKQEYNPISNSAKLRHEQQNQQDYRSRYK